MVGEALGPVGVRFDNANHVGEDCQCVVDEARRRRVQVWDEGGRRGVGELDAFLEDHELFGVGFGGLVAAHSGNACLQNEQRADLGIVKRPGANAF